MSHVKDKVTINDDGILVGGKPFNEVDIKELTKNSKRCDITHNTIVIVHVTVPKMNSSQAERYIVPMQKGLNKAFPDNKVIVIPLNPDNGDYSVDFLFVDSKPQ